MSTGLAPEPGKDLWLLCQCKGGVVTLKVHKIENFLAPILKFVPFHSKLGINIKVL